MKTNYSSGVMVKGVPIPIKFNSIYPEEQCTKVLECQKFNNWAKCLDNNNNVEVKSIDIQHIYMFGRNVGFICADVEAYLNGKRIPGFTFIRGAAVAMLVLVNGRMILTRQYRVPVGKFTIEAPAGMVDESQHFSGVAAKELKEECGIEIGVDEMKFLGTVLISPGGCDEEISLFYVEKLLNEAELNHILDKVHGEENEGEQITLQIKDYNWENVLETKDVKLICAAAYYNQIKSQAKL